MADELPDELILRLGRDDGPDRFEAEFRLIPAGRFRMGSREGDAWEQPVHWVEITEPFYMGVTPVTQRQWRTLVSSPPGLAGDLVGHKNGSVGPDLPVHSVNWVQAMRYCDLLTESLRSGLVVTAGGTPSMSNWIATLPTEAQWEYACRGPQVDAWVTTDCFNGDGETALAMVGWFNGNSERKAHSVRKLLDNAWGLYDMHGNVYEWCWDDWDVNSYRKRVDGVYDPCFPPRSVRWLDRDNTDGGADRVYRGGSYFSSAAYCSSASRFGGTAEFQNRFLGFRVCLVGCGPVPSQSDSGGASEESPAARRKAEAKGGSEERPEAGKVEFRTARLPPSPRSGEKFA